MSKVQPTQALAPSELSDDRYRVTGPRAIQFMIASFIKEREQFTVYYGTQPKDMFLTSLLEVDSEDERLIFDCSGSSDVNRRVQYAGTLNFSGKPAGIRVQFQTSGASEILYQGGRAFSVRLPKTVVRVQRREYFRVQTPRTRQIMCRFRLPDGSLQSLPLYDLSVAGVGLNAQQVPYGLSGNGQKLGKASFYLPEDPREFSVEVVLRRVAEVKNKARGGGYRIGLQFVGLTLGDESRIQRYIDRLERERRDRL